VINPIIMSVFVAIACPGAGNFKASFAYYRSA
jgi:hypothetical protein